MNAEWSALNKVMQNQLNRKDTFDEAIKTLLLLRRKMLEEIFSFKKELTKEEFSAQPYIKAKGYHNKTIAYSLWHIFRIEDIVVHSLMLGDEQIFFQSDFQSRIGAPIITTGNELSGKEIAVFSEKLNLAELYKYLIAVDERTTQFLRQLRYSDLKAQISQENKKCLESLEVVSQAAQAWWLVDYWSNKNAKGLIRMPLSGHWIMHIEASIRIKDKVLL